MFLFLTAITCGDPGSVQFATRSAATPVGGLFTCGSTARFTCNTNYQMTQGQEVITCQPNAALPTSTRGVWTPNLQTNPIVCTPLGKFMIEIIIKFASTCIWPHTISKLNQLFKNNGNWTICPLGHYLPVC